MKRALSASIIIGVTAGSVAAQMSPPSGDTNYVDGNQEIGGTLRLHGPLIADGAGTFGGALSAPSATFTAPIPLDDNSTRAATTAFVRSQLPRANMLTFGADPTGAANSCGTPLTSALASLPVNGGVLYWPRGRYKCSAQIAVTNRSLVVQGDGKDVTFLDFDQTGAGAAGIKFTQNATQASEVHDMTIATLADQTAGNNCIDASYAGAGGESTPLWVSDFECVGAATLPHSFYWNTGFRGHNVNDGKLERFYFAGKSFTPPAGGFLPGTNMFAAVHLSGNSTKFNVFNGQGVLSLYGEYLTGNTERVYTSFADFYANNTCVYNDDDSSGDLTGIGYSAGIDFVNGHCNSYTSHFKLKGHRGHNISNNVLLRRQEAAANFVSFDLLEGNFTAGGAGTYAALRGAVTGNVTDLNYPALTGTATYVRFGTNVFDWVFSGNQAANMQYFADGGGNGVAFRNLITGNLWAEASAGLPRAWQVNPGSGNVFLANINESGTSVNLPNLAVTPSVGGAATRLFYAVNSAATVITNFADGYIGQVITIVATTANTTVQHNADQLLAGGVNYVMAAGKTLTLIKEYSGAWRETGRS